MADNLASDAKVTRKVLDSRYHYLPNLIRNVAVQYVDALDICQSDAGLQKAQHRSLKLKSKTVIGCKGEMKCLVFSGTNIRVDFSYFRHVFGVQVL